MLEYPVSFEYATIEQLREYVAYVNECVNNGYRVNSYMDWTLNNYFSTLEN